MFTHPSSRFLQAPRSPEKVQPLLVSEHQNFRQSMVGKMHNLILAPTGALYVITEGPWIKIKG